MTTQSSTNLNGLGLIPNIPLNNNLFDYANPIIILDSLSFGLQFEILNNPAELPLDLRSQNVNRLIMDGWGGFRSSFESSLNINNILRLNTLSGEFLNNQIGNVERSHFHYYRAIFEQDLPRLERNFDPARFQL